MKYQQKMTRFEKSEMKSQKLEEALAGSGLYLYENRSNAADLTLPKPTKSGRRIIGPKEQFQGDSYFMQLVRTGNLRLIKELQSPQQEALMEEKLILDQPSTVTSDGVVEQVVQPTPKRQLQENKGKTKHADVLINESPVDDSFVIV
jgi:hypothetical protein